MTHKQIFTGRLALTALLRKRMLVGGIIGLALISFFIINAGQGDPTWSDYWRVKPLLITPLLGSIVGLCYDMTGQLRRMEGWLGRLFLASSLIGYVIGLWISLVLGLNGTMWN